MKCTVCNSENSELAFIKGEYRILHCSDCDHLFTDLLLTPKKVVEIYSDSYFKDGGAGYEDYTVEKDMLIHRGEYYADKLSKFIAPGKVLDIGAASGFILKGFENRGWKGTGIEPNKSMADYGKNIVGVNIIKGSFECYKSVEKFDLIILIQVIAHLYNLNSSIKKIYDYLNPGGFLLIETWNKDSLSARLFGKNWHEFSPPSTLNYFSKKTLKELLSHYNFSLAGNGTPKKSIHSKHAKSILRHKLLEMRNLKWMAGITNIIPDNKLIPYPAEDLFWFLLKKTN
ncbi:MAG: class I SAM-dependent methyltransferase [Bacteroidota bacterium]